MYEPLNEAISMSKSQLSNIVVYEVAELYISRAKGIAKTIPQAG
jgi:hypothetical protein